MDMMEQHMNMQTFVNVYQGAVSSENCKEIIDFINSSDLEPGVMSGKTGKEVNAKVKDSLDISLLFPNPCPPSSILRNALHFCVQDYVRRNNELECIQEWGLNESYN